MEEVVEEAATGFLSTPVDVISHQTSSFSWLSVIIAALVAALLISVRRIFFKTPAADDEIKTVVKNTDMMERGTLLRNVRRSINQSNGEGLFASPSNDHPRSPNPPTSRSSSSGGGGGGSCPLLAQGVRLAPMQAMISHSLNAPAPISPSRAVAKKSLLPTHHAPGPEEQQDGPDGRSKRQSPTKPIPASASASASSLLLQDARSDRDAVLRAVAPEEAGIATSSASTTLGASHRRPSSHSFLPSFGMGKTGGASSVDEGDRNERGEAGEKCFRLRFDDGEYVGERRVEEDGTLGEPHGHGTLTFHDGATYSGSFRYGKKHGAGTFRFGDGDQYDGEYGRCSFAAPS
jgi:hypothetical protein